MNIVEAKKTDTTKNGDVMEVCINFLKSDYDVAEITEWNERYSNIQNAYIGFRTVIRSYYSDKIKVSKNGQHIYLERIGK